MSEMVGITEIAKRLKLNTSTVRRLIARENELLQLEIHRGKADILLLSKEDADKLIDSYQSRRGHVDETPQNTASSHGFGYFYIIQLVPEVLPNRVKLGYADNVNQRLREHKTSAPTARLLKSWPCKRSWDYAAMNSIVREGCKLVLNEVYEGDIQGFIDRAQQFFAIMPTPESESELSEHSPLYESEENGAPESSQEKKMD